MKTPVFKRLTAGQILASFSKAKGSQLTENWNKTSWKIILSVITSCIENQMRYVVNYNNICLKFPIKASTRIVLSDSTHLVRWRGDSG